MFLNTVAGLCPIEYLSFVGAKTTLLLFAKHTVGMCSWYTPHEMPAFVSWFQMLSAENAPADAPPPVLPKVSPPANAR